MGRKPRAGDRGAGRRLPAGPGADEADIQPWLDQRRPGASALTSPRAEPDRVRILSGVYRGPDDRHADQPRSSTMSTHGRATIRDDAPPRAGHADAAYEAKYGLRDPRGGGRASARETAARVAAGAVARLVIPEVTIEARVIEIGGEAGRGRWAGADRGGARGGQLARRGSSNASPPASRPAGARRSMPSSTPSWRRRSCRSMR